MSFLLLAHIAIACSGLACTAFAYLKPSQTSLKSSSWLLAGTLTSGTVLTLQTHNSLVSTCISGLIYTVVVTAGIYGASRKLARVPNKID